MPTQKIFLYLASQSARRKEILGKMKIPFCVVPSSYIERMVRTLKVRKPQSLVMDHAKGKITKARLPAKARYVLGADTIVWYRKRILGKPKTWREAVEMITLLSGHSHYVFTGMAMVDRKRKKVLTGYSKTKVFFKQLSERDVLTYVKKIDPFDKAGGYAIQKGPKIVKKIVGSYSNVVGLPVELVKKMLKQIRK